MYSTYFWTLGIYPGAAVLFVNRKVVEVEDSREDSI